MSWLMRLVLASCAILPACAAAPAYAQGQVQGVAVVGSPVAPRPVAIGGRDASGNAQFSSVDANGALLIAGVAPTSSSTAIPVNPGINPTIDACVNSGLLTSNGVTAVTIAAASSGRTVYLLKLSAYNTSTTTLHGFRIVDDVGTLVWPQVQLGVATATTAGGTLLVDADSGSVHGGVGRGLKFVLLDAGGSDVLVTAVTCTK